MQKGRSMKRGFFIFLFFFFHLSSSQRPPKQDIYICNASPLKIITGARGASGPVRLVIPYWVLEMKTHVWKTLLWGKYTQACVHALTRATTHSCVHERSPFQANSMVKTPDWRPEEQSPLSWSTPAHLEPTINISNPHLAPHESYDAQGKMDLGIMYSALCFYLLLYMLFFS